MHNKQRFCMTPIQCSKSWRLSWPIMHLQRCVPSKLGLTRRFDSKKVRYGKVVVRGLGISAIALVTTGSLQGKVLSSF
eukprot:1485-Amphidinium_carterae.1